MTDSLQKFREQDSNDLFRAFLHRTEDGDLVLYLEAAPEVERFFSTDDTGTSDHWFTDSEGAHEYYKRRYSRYGVEVENYFATKYDEFGNSYISSSGNVNKGFLRTAGLSDGVTFDIPTCYSEETLEQSVRELRDTVKELYKEFIKPVSISTTITVREE